MEVSVIIPTRNAEDHIKNLLDRLISQTICPLEIIIVDSDSKDKTKSICKLYNKVRYIRINKEDFNHGGTRNLAASYAKGEVLLFMTQDAYPANEFFIEELIKPLVTNNIVATYGRQLPRQEAGYIEKFSRMFNYGGEDVLKTKHSVEKLGIKAFFFSNVCAAYIKEEFEKCDGFPENTIMNEDMIIASRFIFGDKNTYYASKAEVIHSHKYTYIQQFKRNFDVGVVFADSIHYFAGVKSESEGIKFVKEAVKYLIKNNKFYVIPNLIIESGFKFIGYKMGTNYKKIPMRYVKKMSMHSFYFDKKEEVKSMGAIQ